MAKFEKEIGRTLGELGVVRDIQSTPSAAFGARVGARYPGIKGAFYPKSRRLVLIHSNLSVAQFRATSRRGVLTLTSDNLSSVGDAKETLRPEILGHYDLESFKAEDKKGNGVSLENNSVSRFLPTGANLRTEDQGLT